MSSPGHATIRFYGDLVGLAWDTDRGGEAHIPVARPRSVKDAIEACGVPHTEVDLMLVDGASVGFAHQVQAGDRVSVYPPFSAFDVEAVSRARPDPLPVPQFVLDVHLGRLAERLRLLGFDVGYRNDADDAELAACSVDEQRWLLTRDRGLLMRRVVTHGYLVRATDPDEQCVEVVRRFGLLDEMAPFTRCARCNGTLASVDKAEVADRLPPATRAEQHDFVRCADCGQVYWRGSHSAGMDAFVAAVRAAVGGRAAAPPAALG